MSSLRTHLGVVLLQSGLVVLDVADRTRSNLLTRASSRLIEAAIALYPRPRWVAVARDLTAYPEPEV